MRCATAVQAREEITKTETWLYDNLAAQADLPLHADPVLTVAGMREKNTHLTKVRSHASACLSVVAVDCGSGGRVRGYTYPSRQQIADLLSSLWCMSTDGDERDEQAEACAARPGTSARTGQEGGG